MQVSADEVWEREQVALLNKYYEHRAARLTDQRWAQGTLCALICPPGLLHASMHCPHRCIPQRMEVI